MKSLLSSDNFHDINKYMSIHTPVSDTQTLTYPVQQVGVNFCSVNGWISDKVLNEKSLKECEQENKKTNQQFPDQRNHETMLGLMSGNRN